MTLLTLVGTALASCCGPIREYAGYIDATYEPALALRLAIQNGDPIGGAISVSYPESEPEREDVRFALTDIAEQDGVITFHVETWPASPGEGETWQTDNRVFSARIVRRDELSLEVMPAEPDWSGRRFILVRTDLTELEAIALQIDTATSILSLYPRWWEMESRPDRLESLLQLDVLLRHMINDMVNERRGAARSRRWRQTMGRAGETRVP